MYLNYNAYYTRTTQTTNRTIQNYAKLQTKLLAHVTRTTKVNYTQS